MKYRSVFGCFLFSLLVYLGSVLTFPLSAYTVPAFVSIAGALAAVNQCEEERLSAARAALTIAAAWLVGNLIGPPQRILFDSFFYEAGFVQFINSTHSSAQVQTALLVAASAFAVGKIRWSHGKLRWAALILLFFATVAQLLNVWSWGKNLPKIYHAEPPARSYHFDGILFNKILHVYKSGKNYYEACDIGMQSDSRTYLPGYPWNSFRPPVHFWLLTLLPDLGLVPLVYWGLTILLQFAVYLASRRLLEPIPAILAPLLLGAYLTYQNTTTFLLMPDVGGGQLTVLAMAIYLIVGWPLAFATLALGGLVREFGVGYLILAALLAWRAGRRKEAAGAAFLVAVDATIYLWHNYCCRTILGMVASAPLEQRLHGSPTFALAALRHGWIFILQGQIFIPMLAALAIIALFRFRQVPAIQLLLVPTLLLLLAFLKIGDPGFAQYYGFSVAPALIWGGSLAVGSLFGFSEPEVEPASPSEEAEPAGAE